MRNRHALVYNLYGAPLAIICGGSEATSSAYLRPMVGLMNPAHCRLESFLDLSWRAPADSDDVTCANRVFDVGDVSHAALWAAHLARLKSVGAMTEPCRNERASNSVARGLLIKWSQNQAGGPEVRFVVLLRRGEPVPRSLDSLFTADTDKTTRRRNTNLTSRRHITARTSTPFTLRARLAAVNPSFSPSLTYLLLVDPRKPGDEIRKTGLIRIDYRRRMLCINNVKAIANCPKANG